MSVKNHMIGRIGVLALLCTLGGCSAVECDPNSGGLIDSVRCLSGGSYKERVEMRKGDLEQEQARTVPLEQQHTDLHRKYDLSQQQVSEYSQRLNQLDAQSRKLKGQLERLQTKNSEQEKQRAEFRARYEDIGRQIDQLQQAVTTGTLSEEELKREIARLEKEREELANAIASVM